VGQYRISKDDRSLSGGSIMNILVVDDNHKTLKLLKAVLSKHGHSVITSDNAPEALSLLSQTPIDLILSDMMMPGMNGAEFCEAVRKEEEQHIPIIFLSARSSVDDVATGMIAGADDYLAKPIKMHELVQKIEEYNPQIT
jgi:DNA-binding response OmpR family regulator